MESKAKASKTTSMTDEVKTVKFKLPNKKILVKPIIKATPFISDTNHVASFLAPNAHNRYCVPVARNGNYVNILTNEEKEYFESPESGTSFKSNDLSVYKKEDNFWESFEIRLGKETKELNLSDPIDYITYKVLLANKDIICDNVDKQFLKVSYKYVLVDAEEELVKKSSESETKMDAYIKFNEIKNSRVKMINFIKVMGKAVAPNSSDDFLKTEIMNLIESKGGSAKFLEIMNDPFFEVKVTFRDSVRQGLIIKRDGAFFTKDLKELGRSESQVIEHLADPLNQDTLILLESKLKQI